MMVDGSGLPAYVERGGEVVYSPPGVATGVRMYAFMLRADTTRLQQMFDRYLNEPSGAAVSFEPAGSLIVLNFTTLAHVGALTPPDVERGYFEESEVAIWTLGYDRVSQTYATFVPYMIVDRGSAMAMGREVYGFPKQLGSLEMPAPDARPDDFALHIDGVPEWGPNEAFEQHTLVRITQGDPSAPMPTHDFASQQELVLEIAKLVQSDTGLLAPIEGDGIGDIAHVGRAIDLLASETLPMVFLKQIRDGRMPLRACYQAVQTADFVVTGFRGAGHLPGSYSVDIAELVNEPIRGELGLPSGPLQPVGAFWVDFDFTLSVADVIWHTSGGPEVRVSREAGGRDD